MSLGCLNVIHFSLVHLSNISDFKHRVVFLFVVFKVGRHFCFWETNLLTQQHMKVNPPKHKANFHLTLIECSVPLPSSPFCHLSTRNMNTWHDTRGPALFYFSVYRGKYQNKVMMPQFHEVSRTFCGEFCRHYKIISMTSTLLSLRPPTVWAAVNRVWIIIKKQVKKYF